MKILTASVLVLSAFALSGARASAQGLGPSEEQKRLELVEKIRKDLDEIDRLLLEAERDKTGNVREKMAAAAKEIEKLLESAQKSQASVCENIEELVRMTKYQKSSSSNSDGDSQSQSQGKDGKPRERQKDKDDGKLLPQPQQPEGEKPQGGGDQKPQPKPQSKGDPKDGQPDHSQGEQEKADRNKPPGEKGNFQRDDTTGRWGVLPQKEAELLQSLSQQQFPEKYRKLLNDFYRRANQVEKKQ